MRLTEKQKLLVLEQRPGSKLARVGMMWAVVWHDENYVPKERWRGQMVKDVVVIHDDTTIRWAGSEVCGKTRLSVVLQLKEEALR